jgi:hypothetical protein
MTTLALADLSHDVPVIGPLGVGVGTLGATWTQVLGSDSVRRGIVFHNPGSNNLRVCPANVSIQPAHGEGALLVYPQEDLVILSENEQQNVNCAWMAWVDVGSNQPVSILNFTSVNAANSNPEPLARLNTGSAIASPVSSGVLLGTAVVSAIGSNAQRRGIAFHNPGTVAVSVCPSNLSVAYGVAGSIIVLPGQTKTYMAKPLSRIRVSCGWNAASQSGSNNPLTILEYLG